MSEDTSFLSFNSQPTTVFSPKLFVGCLLVDSYYNPSLIPTTEIIIDFSGIQLNLMACLQHGGMVPKILKNMRLTGGLLPTHKCFSLNLSNVLCHASIFSELNIHFDLETEFGCDTMDYTYMNYQPFVENFKIRSYLEYSSELKINVITNVLHLHYGQSVSHALSVMKRMLDMSESEKEEQDLILMTRYIVCNNTSNNLLFGQFGTDESITLPFDTFYLYFLQSDQQHKEICIELNDEKSLPIQIDKDGVYKRLLGEDYILIVTIEGISSFQKKIVITGHVEFYNMTTNDFQMQYKMYPNTVDTTLDSVTIEKMVHSKSIGSAIGKCMEGSQESIRIKFANQTKKGWSGEIPLKEIIKNNKPWMVKVPAANKFGEVCFWVRIIREDIEEFRFNKNFCPQRALVIIWPLFQLKSNLSVSTTAYESAQNQNYTVFGRGEIKEMQMPGTFEEDHQLTFKMQ